MRRAALLLLALLALATPLAGCGGGDDDDGGATTGASPSATGEAAPGEPGGGPDASGGREPADGSSAGDSPDGSGPGAAPPGSVDLTVDPGSIDGARVTPTGAVQTLPPRERSHQVAEENGYSSINSFGQEATGEEATNITFALVQYLNAKVEADWATACARLYSVLRENLERGPDGQARSCTETYGALMSRVPKATLAEQARIDVSSVRRGEGNRAFVVYKTPDTLSADMPMYVEDGVWKVGALEAYALTPDQVG